MKVTFTIEADTLDVEDLHAALSLRLPAHALIDIHVTTDEDDEEAIRRIHAETGRKVETIKEYRWWYEQKHGFRPSLRDGLNAVTRVVG